MVHRILNRTIMGCGDNCACATDKPVEITPDEIVEATAPDGTDVTKEMKANMAKHCSSDSCQNGACERCSTEGAGHTCEGGDSCCKTKDA